MEMRICSTVSFWRMKGSGGRATRRASRGGPTEDCRTAAGMGPLMEPSWAPRFPSTMDLPSHGGVSSKITKMSNRESVSELWRISWV